MAKDSRGLQEIVLWICMRVW